MCLPYVSHTSPSFPICFLYLSTYFHTFSYFFPYLNPAKQQSLRGNRADRFPKSCHWATHSPAVRWSFKRSPKKRGFPRAEMSWHRRVLYLSTVSVTTIRKNHLWLLVIAYSCLIIATPKQRTESGKPGNMQTVVETLFSASFWDFLKKVNTVEYLYLSSSCEYYIIYIYYNYIIIYIYNHIYTNIYEINMQRIKHHTVAIICTSRILTSWRGPERDIGP